MQYKHVTTQDKKNQNISEMRGQDCKVLSAFDVDNELSKNQSRELQLHQWLMVPWFEWKNQMFLLVLVFQCESQRQMNPQQSPSLEPLVLLAWLKPDDESGPDDT